MPTKDCNSSPPTTALSEDTANTGPSGHQIKDNQASKSAAMFPRHTREEEGRGDSFTRLPVDQNTGDLFASESSNLNMEENRRPGSGTRDDPIEIMQFSQDRCYVPETYDDDQDEEGISMIPPSPENQPGPVLGTKSPRIPSPDDAAYVTCLENSDAKSEQAVKWNSPRRQFPWEIPRRITFSQDNSQQSQATPMEARETISGFARQQLSPTEKATKRSLPAGEDGEHKKWKATTPSAVINRDSNSKDGSQEDWQLHLSESQNSQSQNTTTVRSQGTNFLFSENRSTLHKEVMSPVEGTGSGSAARGPKLLDKVRKDMFEEKRTSTPIDGPEIQDSPVLHNKATFRIQPPSLLQLSRASTITPNSSHNMITPSTPPEYTDMKNVSDNEHHNQDKVLVDSTATSSSSIFQRSNSSINNSSEFLLDESYLNLSKNNDSLHHHSSLGEPHSPTELHNSSPDLPPQQDQLKTVTTNCQENNADKLTNNQIMRVEDNHAPGLHTTPAKNPDQRRSVASKFTHLVSPEVKCGSSSFDNQKKRPHSDEEFVRRVRPTKECSIQTDMSFSEESHLSKGCQTLSGNESVGSGMQPSQETIVICYRDALCRSKETRSSNGLILKSEILDYKEWLADRVEDLPNWHASQDSRNWNSLTSGEMADVSSSIQSSKSTSTSSLHSLVQSNISCIPQPSQSWNKRRSASMQMILDKRAQAIPQSSSSSVSPPAHDHDSDIFARPLEPVNVMSSKDDAVPTEAIPDPPLVLPPSVTPKKGTPGRKRKKGSGNKGRRTPKTASPRKAKNVAVNLFSPEVQSVGDVCVKTEEYNPDNPAGLFKPGMLVMARWADTHYYFGVLDEIDSTGRWKVKFGDGSQRWVKEADILEESLVTEGQSVLAKNQNFYDPGIIRRRIIKDDDQVVFDVELDNGMTIGVNRGDVSLSSDQAAIILRRRAPDQPVSSLSLDNIVEGKRRRTPKAFSDCSPGGTRNIATRGLNASPQVSPLQSKSRRKPDANLQKSDYASTADEESRSFIPRLKSPAKHLRGNPDPFQFNDSENENVSRTACSPQKTSLALTTINLSSLDVQEEDDTVKLGPLPTNEDVFKGLYFLISCADRNLRQQQPIDALSSSDSSIDELPLLDREHVTLQLTTGGGVVFDTFDETQTVPKKQVFLVTNTYLRTMKYIECLASGIPCVCVEWVKHCCRKNKLLRWEDFALPAGRSIIDDQEVDRSLASVGPLHKMNIMLWSEDNPDFASFWTPVILAAQASSVHRKFGTKLPPKLGHVQVVVSDQSLSPNVLQRFSNLNIPVVSSEWLIQCIITGAALPFDAHPKFKHNYIEN